MLLVFPLFFNLVLIVLGQQPQPNEMLFALKPQTKIFLPSPKSELTIVPKPNTKPLNVTASSALIYERASGTILFEKNTSSPLAMASLTKIMTALTIVQGHSLDETVEIPETLPALGPEDQKLGIVSKEEFKLRDLIRALLVNSSNDVANALAIWDSGSIDGFSDKMNAQARLWGLNNSQFQNPTGLDAPDHKSSSQDLLVLSNLLLENKTLANITSQPNGSIKTLSGKPYVFVTTNKALGSPNIIGLKTGYTLEAGQSLILRAKKDQKDIITIVLNSSDRFIESKSMVDWAFNNFIWKTPNE